MLEQHGDNLILGLHVGIGETEFGPQAVAGRTRSVTGSSSLAMMPRNVASSGGVLRYSTVSKSTPSSLAMLTALFDEFQ